MSSSRSKKRRATPQKSSEQTSSAKASSPSGRILKTTMGLVAPWVGPLLYAIQIHNTIDAALKQMDVEREETRDIHDKGQRINEQLGVMYEVCLNSALPTLHPNARTAYVARIDACLTRAQDLHETINCLDDAIQQDQQDKDHWTNRVWEYASEATRIIGVPLEEPEWKKLHTKGNHLLESIQADIDALNVISLNTINRNTAETTVMLQEMIHEFREGRRTRQRKHAPSRHPSQSLHRLSASNATEHGQDLLEMVRHHSTYRWDSTLDDLILNNTRFPRNSNCRIAVFEDDSESIGPSILIWLADGQFWHFQVRQDLPYSSMPVRDTSRAVIIMLASYRFSGLKAITSTGDETGHVNMRATAEFPTRKDAQIFCSHIEGYSVLSRSRAKRLDQDKEEHGVSEIIDFPLPYRYEIEENHSEDVDNDGSLRVFQFWPYLHGAPWAVNRSEILLHIVSKGTQYSICSTRPRVLQFDNARLYRTCRGVATLRPNFSEEEDLGTYEVGSFQFEFEEKNKAARMLKWLVRDP